MRRLVAFFLLAIFAFGETDELDGFNPAIMTAKTHVQRFLQTSYADQTPAFAVSQADRDLENSEKKLRMVGCFKFSQGQFMQNRDQLLQTVEAVAAENALREDDLLRVVFSGFITSCYHNADQEKDVPKMIADTTKGADAMRLLWVTAQTPFQLSEEQAEILTHIAEEYQNTDLAGASPLGRGVSGRMGLVFTLVILAGVVSAFGWVAVRLMRAEEQRKGKKPTKSEKPEKSEKKKNR